MSGDQTFFDNESGGAGSVIDYVKDSFQDISVQPTNNGSFTDNSTTNPMGNFYGNDDSPRYSVKTLYIKDIVLIKDRSKWINNEPTYSIIWNEAFPPVTGYVFGNIQFQKNNNQTYVQVRKIGDGIGLGGVIRRVQYLLADDTATTATAQVSVDGVNGSVINFSGLASSSSGLQPNKYSAFVSSATNETYDLHDIRLTALQVNTLKIVGVIVYYEDAGADIDFFPGITYVDKDKKETLVGATLPLPSFSGSSMGGNGTLYKGVANNYLDSARAATFFSSIANGASGTNLVTVSTGFGGSFPIGSGVVMEGGGGASQFLASVLNQSTDTLTVYPTLPIGISGLIYKAWHAGSTIAINASFFQLSSCIGASQFIGFTGQLFDPLGKWAFIGNTTTQVGVTFIGATYLDGIWPAIVFPSSNGNVQIDGYFSAAEIEFVGNGILHATLTVNGLPAWGINEGSTGPIRKTIFSNAGPGWNSFNLSAGNSLGAVGINKVNLYKYKYDIGISFGRLASFDTLNAYVNVPTHDKGFHAIGIFQRTFGDQLYFKGTWTRELSPLAPGGAQYVSNSGSTALIFEYFGKNFTAVGTGSSYLSTLDGASVGIIFSTANIVSSEGFHRVVITPLDSSNIIQAIDFSRTRGELTNLQSFSPIPDALNPVPAIASQIWLNVTNNYGSTALAVRRWSKIIKYSGQAMTYSDSATQGMAIMINEDGWYAITYTDDFGATANFAITLNGTGTDLNASPNTLNITAPDKVIAMTTSDAAARYSNCSGTVYLRTGDIVRSQGDQNTTGTNTNSLFRITKIG